MVLPCGQEEESIVRELYGSHDGETRNDTRDSKHSCRLFSLLADGRREYDLMLLLMMIYIFPTTDCNAGFGDNGRGECVACGDGSYSGAGEASCTFCGPNTNTGGNDEATSSAECGR